MDLIHTKIIAGMKKLCMILTTNMISKCESHKRYKCGETKFRLINGSVWYFIPKGKFSHCGDYDRAFNGSKFFIWFQHQLIYNLNIPSLILIDNASYLKCVPQEFHAVSKLKWRDPTKRYGYKNPIFATNHCSGL